MAVDEGLEKLKRLQSAVNNAVAMAEAGQFVHATTEELDKYWPTGLQKHQLLIGNFGIDEVDLNKFDLPCPTGLKIRVIANKDNTGSVVFLTMIGPNKSGTQGFLATESQCEVDHILSENPASSFDWLPDVIRDMLAVKT